MNSRIVMPLAWALVSATLISNVLGAPAVRLLSPELSSRYDCTGDDVSETWKNLSLDYSKEIVTEFSADQRKLCVQANYNFECENERRTERTMWTKFNVSESYGKAILYFISMDNKVPIMPGFTWSEACEINYNSRDYILDNNVATFTVTPTTPDICSGSLDEVAACITALVSVIENTIVRLVMCLFSTNGEQAILHKKFTHIR